MNLPTYSLREAVAVESNVYPTSRSSKVPPGVRCHYCQGWATTKDHIVPKVAGGADSFWNYVPACQTCNLSKGASRPTCECAHCTRAVKLWRSGHRRKGAPKPRVARVVSGEKIGLWASTIPMIDGRMAVEHHQTLKAALDHTQQEEES